MNKTDLTGKHILTLTVASVVAKILITFVTVYIFHSFLDAFDMGGYIKHVQMLYAGQSPFNGNFPYPVLSLIPMVMASLFGPSGFTIIFPCEMILCDVVTTVCVYLIAKKIWELEDTAYRAGLLYCTMLPCAYFVITKFDAFPVALMMLAITFTLYGDMTKGYLLSIAGFFVKLFPIIPFPYILLYASKEREGNKEWIWAAVLAAFIFSVVAIFWPGTAWNYFPINSGGSGQYVNTLPAVISAWLSVDIGVLTVVGYAIAGVIVAFLLYTYYIRRNNDDTLFIKFILITIVLAVLSFRIRSPQYMLWYVPLLCVLSVKTVRGVLSLIAFQIIAYIEFPLAFGSLYVNTAYIAGKEMLGLIVFTFYYAALFYCIGSISGSHPTP